MAQCNNSPLDQITVSKTYFDALDRNIKQYLNSYRLWTILNTWKKMD